MSCMLLDVYDFFDLYSSIMINNKNKEDSFNHIINIILIIGGKL